MSAEYRANLSDGEEYRQIQVKIMLRVLVMAGFVLLAPRSMAIAAGDACATALSTVENSNSAAPSANTPTPAWSARLLDALTTSEPDQARALARAINAIPREHPDDPLVQRARLIYAGLLLADGTRTDASAKETAKSVAAARDILRQIHTDSEAALPAALLLAESYAIAGDLPGAVQRNLVAVHWWPEEPAALAALLQRAGAYTQIDLAAAQPPLMEVRNRAAYAVLQLDTLASRLAEQNWFALWLADGKEPALTPELAPLFYRTLASEAFQRARGAARATAKPGECAREQIARLQRLRADMTRVAAESNTAIQTLHAQLAHDRTALKTKQEQYLADDEKNTALGREITRLRNLIVRNETELTTLQSGIANLPAAHTSLAKQIAALQQISNTINAQSTAETLAALKTTISERRAQLLDIAGSASLMLGELQDPRYRKVP